MSKLRTFIAAAATAATLGIAALAATPASAHGFEHHGFGGFHGGFGRFHDGFRFHDHWRYSWGWGHRGYCGWRDCGPHFGSGYGGPEVVVGEVPVCPVGYHLGTFGRHCWPNRP
jgi:hypothetical protein